MAKKLLSIDVDGDHHHWSFNFYGDPKYIPEWEADGLKIWQIENIIPIWIPGWLVRPWCFCQDIFHLKNPF